MNILQFLIDIRSRDNGVIGQVTQLQTRLDEADRSATRLANTVGVKLKSAFMSLPGAEFLTNPIVALTAGVGVVSKMGMEAEKTAVSFEVLTGSQQTANQMIAEMNKYAADSPYSRLGVQDAAKTMMGFGVAQKDVMSSLKTLGDIAMGDSERFKGLALVFSQVAANGKLQGQDLLQLVNNGYNPLLDISRLTGKSVAELRQEMTDGKIPFEMMRQAMLLATSEGGKFYGMTEKIAQTPFGRFGQLVDQFKDTLINLYNVIQPLLIPTFDLLSSVLRGLEPIINGTAKMVNWLVGLFKNGNPILMGFVATVVSYTTAAGINTFVLKGWTVAQWAQVTAMIAAEKAMKLLNLTMWKNPIFWVAAGIGILTGAIIACWNKFAGFRAAVYATWDAMKGFGVMIKDYIVDRFWQMIEGIGSIGKALVKLVKGNFNEAWEEAQKGAQKIAGIERNAQFKRDFNNLGTYAANNYDNLLRIEQAKQKAKLSSPTAAGGIVPQFGQGTGTGEGTGTDNEGKANNITAGGTRNTQITINISKFFDYLNVTMMDKADGSEIERIVLESMNRALETATSAAR